MLVLRVVLMEKDAKNGIAEIRSANRVPVERVEVALSFSHDGQKRPPPLEKALLQLGQITPQETTMHGERHGGWPFLTGAQPLLRCVGR
jgi:hypothetical protein